MATNVQSENGSILTCELCTKVYRDPVMLPCLHSFCLDCLTKYADKEGLADGKIICHTCKVPSPLPSGNSGISGFPSNLRLSHLVELQRYRDKIVGKKTVPCEQCKNNTAAVVFCSSCRLFMCTGCKDEHQRWRDLRNHKLYEFESSSKKDAEKSEGNRSFEIELPPQECRAHNERIMYYCQECKVPICRDCIIVDHEKHPRNYIAKMADQEKSQITSLIAGMPDAIHKLNDAIARGKQMRQQVEASQSASLATINTSCDQLKTTIEQRRKELLGNAKVIAQGKDDVLSSQMQDLQNLKDTLEFCFAQAEDAAMNYTADELICVTIAVKDQVDWVLKQFQDISLDLQENEKIGTSMVIAPILQQIKALGFFPGVANPKYSYIEGAGVKVALVGTERKIKVVLMDEKNTAIKDDALFQYKLVYKGSNQSVTPKGAIKQSGTKDGTAFLSFVPPAAGLYEVTILVRKRLIEQRPYQFWAHAWRDYAKLPAQAALEFKCGGSVYGAAVHPSGDLYVAEHDLNLIQVFKPDGSKKCTIGGPDNAGGELNKPVGVVIIEDTLFVVSMGNNCIKMYTINGGAHVGTIGKEGSGNTDLKGPLGACSDGKGHIVIVDQTNKRIQLFATNGTFYKKIPCNNPPHEVAVDAEGNIHVTQATSKLIQVYTPAGTKHSTYNVNNTLTGPQGIAVHADGTKIIAEPTLIRIVNPAGAEVANRDGMNGARCVMFGYDGSVFVCDAANKRVLKY